MSVNIICWQLKVIWDLDTWVLVLVLPVSSCVTLASPVLSLFAKYRFMNITFKVSTVSVVSLQNSGFNLILESFFEH